MMIEHKGLYYMCGIVGWIDTEKMLKGQEKIVETMTNTLAKRGPDAYGLYTADHAVLGHRRLVVVDPAGGAQPMTRYKGEYPCTIVYNGELYNTEDLRKILKEKGYTFHSHSDTEVLLTSYLEWKEQCVDYLNGIYAFAIWDEREKSLFMARDRLGVKPFFYAKRGSSLLFASELKALLQHPLVEPIIEEQGILEIFGLGPARSPGVGVFKDVYEILPGECALYKDAKINKRQYWKLVSQEHTESIDQTVERVRHLLIDAVERQLVADVPVCTFLSGGLDSSAISSIAAGAFKRDGKELLHTYSIDYVDNDIYFKANDFQPDADSYWIERMQKYIGSVHHNVVVGIEELTETLKDAVKANDVPGMADVDSSLYIFCKEVRKNATVALSGECADEIFGGYPWFRKKEFIEANTFPWAQSTKERVSILSPDLSHLPIEEYVANRYQETLKEVPRLEGESASQHRMREISYLNLKWFMITLLNRKDRMSMSNSLEVRVPFADHRIVEYAWNIPWEMKYIDQREKGLLRRALKGILPEDVLYRRKSPYPKTHHPYYTTAVQNWMRQILSDRNSPILQLVHFERVKEIVETGGTSFGKPWFGQLMTGPQLIAYLAQVNEWMKSYNVQLK